MMMMTMMMKMIIIILIIMIIIRTDMAHKAMSFVYLLGFQSVCNITSKAAEKFTQQTQTRTESIVSR